MVMDGYGFGRCVGYCFISNENKDVVKAALQCFIDANSSETELIKQLYWIRMQLKLVMLRK